MPDHAPKIDRRGYDEIVSQTRSLLQHYTDWRPPDHHADAGSALVGIFGRMAEIVVDRLNRSPEKNFLAFLDLIGAHVRPPRAARVALTFRLAEGSPADALVPARTQVAAPPATGEGEILFETDADLVVTRARLVAAFADDPRADTFSDLTDVATGVTDHPFAVFAGDTPVEHSLYLARDDFFLLSGPKRVTVTMTLADPKGLAEFRALPIAWEFWTGTAWQALAPTAGGQGAQYAVTFDSLPVLARCPVNGVEAGWLRARLRNPLPPGHAAVPAVTSIGLSVRISRTGEVPPRAFANAVPLDVTRDFFPLGEQPRLNDALYLALPEASARPGASLTLHLTLSNPTPVPLKPSADLALTWEVWDGAAWQVLAVTGSPSGTAKLTAGGTVAVTLPATFTRRPVNGEVAHWVRARLTAGNYGSPVAPKVTSQTDRDGRVTGVTVTMEGGYGPPSLAALTVSSVATQSGPPAACLTKNGFTFVDCTAAAGTSTSPFAAFTPATEPWPALYLGFDRAFDNRPVTLYLGVDAPRAGDVAAAVRRPGPVPVPRVVWEYRGAQDWRPLGAADGTEAFGESGEVRFIGPQALAAHREFGHEGYWIRARWQDGAFLVTPRLRRLALNTTWATQATTLQDEILGSSTGEADQGFRTTQSPVLLGQRLEVREPELPPAHERAALVALEGDAAVTILSDQTGDPGDIWVQWHAVSDFHGSGPRDRHYVIDALSGQIRFGDGQRGLAPPPGRDNIRMARYRTGGGAQGNQPAGTITQLKTTVPYVEVVVNLDAAQGGADREDLERVKERGPRGLRHQDRAVTVQDFEDLAYEASPDVARVQALMPVFDPISSEWLPVWHLPVDRPGDIAVEVSGFAGTLAVSISGPGRGLPAAQGEGQRQLAVAHTVASREFATGDVWRVAIVNREAQPARTGQVKISYPGGTLEAPLEAPAIRAYTPTSDIRQPGRVELVIVPRDPVPLPSPSASLVTRVREYLLARSAPGLALLVTEPDWVEVTVTAEVIPTTPDAADLLRATAVAAVERFLHPLTGGFDHQGWPFGRRPHVSDLFTVLESVPGLRYVRSLAVVNRPSLADIDPPQPGEAVEDDPTLPRLSKDLRERFLIHSGRHVITVSPGELR